LGFPSPPAADFSTSRPTFCLPEELAFLILSSSSFCLLILFIASPAFSCGCAPSVILAQNGHEIGSDIRLLGAVDATRHKREAVFRRECHCNPDPSIRDG
jgi:hypothetical protein